MSDRLEEIEGRLAKAPQGEYRIALGSGTCVMTGVYVDTEAGTFLAADCCTDDAVKEGYALPDHRPVMELFCYAPADIAYLVAEVKCMREVYTSAMAFYDAADDDMTSEETVDLFDACRKAREERE